MKQLTTKLIILSSFLVIASCSSLSPYKVPVLQGNIVEEKDLDKLSVGLTKDQIQFIFGSALIKDPFHQSRWDYYNSIQIGEEVIQETKLSIKFDEDELVESWVIEKLSEDN
tara:strand:+ start:34 stop:369 length:336 start_codon:yes stop_codon:yes gene_type:complete